MKSRVIFTTFAPPGSSLLEPPLYGHHNQYFNIENFELFHKNVCFDLTEPGEGIASREFNLSTILLFSASSAIKLEASSLSPSSANLF